MRRLLWLVATLALLAGCAAPTPAVSPLRLPTRAPTATVTPTATPIGAALRHQAGRAYRAAGENDAALAAFSEAIEIDPDLAPAYVERGAIYLARGEASAALADAQAALAADPESAVAYALLGEVLRSAFDAPVQALEAYDRAVDLDPTLAEVTFPARWRTAVDARQANRMLTLANEYAAAYPDDPLRHHYRARALIGLGRVDTAIEGLVDALEDSGPAAIWFALGDAYAARRAWNHAATCYEQARALVEAGDMTLALVTDNPAGELSVALGRAYLYLGRCFDAQALFHHARAMGSEQSEIPTMIGQALICLTPTPTPTPYPWLISP